MAPAKMILQSIVPPGDISSCPPLPPHDPLMVCLPQFAELFDKIIDVLAAHARAVWIRSGTLNEGICTRLGQIVLGGRGVPKSHEQELRVESLLASVESADSSSAETSCNSLAQEYRHRPGRPRAALSRVPSIWLPGFWPYRTLLAFHFSGYRVIPVV